MNNFNNDAAVRVAASEVFVRVNIIYIGSSTDRTLRERLGEDKL